MNKSQLVDKLVLEADLSKAAASRFLDAFIGTVTDALKAGEPVVLVGFGSFVVRERAARTGRNPKTGEPIPLAAAKVPGFRAGKMLKEQIN